MLDNKLDTNKAVKKNGGQGGIPVLEEGGERSVPALPALLACLPTYRVRWDGAPLNYIVYLPQVDAYWVYLGLASFLPFSLVLSSSCLHLISPFFSFFTAFSGATRCGVAARNDASPSLLRLDVQELRQGRDPVRDTEGIGTTYRA